MSRRPTEVQDTQDLRQLILETHVRLRQDHFEVLGISRSATESDVRQAYTRFARVLHPDARRPASLADVEEKRDEVFLRVTAAYETLRDPEARRKYEIAFEPSKLRGPKTPTPSPSTPPTPAPDPEPAAAAPPPPSPPPAEPEASPEPSGPDHAATLRDAETLFAKEDYWGAIQRVEPLIPHAEGVLRTRGVLLLARAYMKNPKWQKRAEDVLLGLLRDAPECTPAYLFLGQIYSGQGLPSRARSMYRKVLELAPDHQAAPAELAKLEPTPPPEEPREGGGLRDCFKGRRRTGD